MSLQTNSSPHLTVKQLAERWHKSEQAIYAMRHKGKAPRAFKSGIGVLFPLSEVEQWEADRMIGDRLSNRRTALDAMPAQPRRSRRTRRPAAA